MVWRYFLFLTRGLPSFDYEIMSDIRIINICTRCVDFPWGGIPESKEGKRKLVLWLQEADKALLFREIEREQQLINANKLTTMW